SFRGCKSDTGVFGGVHGRKISSLSFAYLNSEARWFSQLKAAGHNRDPARVYFALLNWLQRFEPLSPRGNLDALKQAAADPELDRELAAIETDLFAPQTGAASDWSPRRLLKRVSLVRRRLLRSMPTQPRQKILPDSLNPVMSRPQVIRCDAPSPDDRSTRRCYESFQVRKKVSCR